VLKAVIDTTVLVSAFLNPRPGGAAHELLRVAGAGAFEIYLSDDIIEETAGVLLTRGRLRRRYQYADADVVEYCRALAHLATVVQDVPEVSVVRDPSDDMIVGCAVAAGADYLVTRDEDLLSLGHHADIAIVSPENFLQVLRQSS
jgi:uncharacterized protein